MSLPIKVTCLTCHYPLKLHVLHVITHYSYMSYLAQKLSLKARRYLSGRSDRYIPLAPRAHRSSRHYATRLAARYAICTEVSVYEKERVRDREREQATFVCVCVCVCVRLCVRVRVCVSQARAFSFGIRDSTCGESPQRAEKRPPPPPPPPPKKKARETTLAYVRAHRRREATR